MIVIDSDTNSGTRTSPQKDTEQDIRIDSLQLAINSINSQITAINSTVSALQTSLNAQINSVTQTLLNSLSSQISALSDSLETQIETGQITASVGNLQRLSVTVSATIKEILTESLKGTLVEAGSLRADSATITEAAIQNLTSPELSATVATIQTINAELLNITSFVVSSLTADSLGATDAEIGNAEIGEVKTNRITGKTWHTPISTPDNTELLRIVLPKFNGVIQFITQDNEFNITVLNNTFVSFNQAQKYIYRVETNGTETNIYLQNIGDTVNYQILLFGADDDISVYSEIVDKTEYEQNVDSYKGYVSSELAENITIDGDSYSTVEDALNALIEMLPLVENLAFNKVVVSDSEGKLQSSEISTTELNSLSGISGNIQNQIDTEKTARGEADSLLSDRITDETAARISGDDTLEEKKQDKELSTPVSIQGMEYGTVEEALQVLAALYEAFVATDIIYIASTETLIFPTSLVSYNPNTEEITVTGLDVTYDSENEELTFSK